MSSVSAHLPSSWLPQTPSQQDLAAPQSEEPQTLFAAHKAGELQSVLKDVFGEQALHILAELVRFENEFQQALPDTVPRSPFPVSYLKDILNAPELKSLIKKIETTNRVRILRNIGLALVAIMVVGLAVGLGGGCFAVPFEVLIAAEILTCSVLGIQLWYEEVQEPGCLAAAQDMLGKQLEVMSKLLFVLQEVGIPQRDRGQRAADRIAALETALNKDNFLSSNPNWYVFKYKQYTLRQLLLCKSIPGHMARAIKDQDNVTSRNLFVSLSELDPQRVRKHLEDQVSALWFAAVNQGDVEACQAFLAAGINANIQDKDGRTALHHAVQSYQWAVVVFLLEAGAYRNVQDKSGMPPSAYATGHKKLCWQRILQGLRGTTLHYAVLSQDEERCEALLRCANTAVDAQDSYGKRALHYAVDVGSKRMCVALLRAGALVDAPDGAGRTALHCAILFNNKELSSFLLREGADWDAKDNQGESVLKMARRKDRMDLLMWPPLGNVF